MIDRWPHPACLDEETLLRSCTVSRGRAGGPGGQHRNKVETLVMLTHTPTGLQAHAGERRSQIENRHVAVFRLRLLLAAQVRVVPPRLKGTAAIDGHGASALWMSRLQDSRIKCNPEHQDFPSMLAEALDVVADSGWDVAAAARHLGATPTQLARFIADHPPSFERVNTERVKRGIHPLR